MPPGGDTSGRSDRNGQTWHAGAKGLWRDCACGHGPAHFAAMWVCQVSVRVWCMCRFITAVLACGRCTRTWALRRKMVRMSRR